jgi:cold shock CspA family protein
MHQGALTLSGILILTMARPQEALNKKEFEKRKLQKRKEKEARKEERKANSKGGSFEDMIAYIDENGNITSTPPDPSKKRVINENDIVIGARNSDNGVAVDPVRKGKVTFFNNSKGYGFIKDTETGDSVFVHSNGLLNSIKENDMVSFETERGPKGYNAVRVSVIK